MMDRHGVNVPFHTKSDGPPSWPSTDANGNWQGPGYVYTICDGCEQEVYRIPRGGVNQDWHAYERSLNEAIRFHMEMCPKLTEARRRDTNS